MTKGGRTAQDMADDVHIQWHTNFLFNIPEHVVNQIVLWHFAMHPLNVADCFVRQNA